MLWVSVIMVVMSTTPLVSGDGKYWWMGSGGAFSDGGSNGNNNYQQQQQQPNNNYQGRCINAHATHLRKYILKEHRFYRFRVSECWQQCASYHPGHSASGCKMHFSFCSHFVLTLDYSGFRGWWQLPRGDLSASGVPVFRSVSANQRPHGDWPLTNESPCITGRVSDCWSVGQPDVDCLNNALCCFDGCANVCQGAGEEDLLTLHNF